MTSSTDANHAAGFAYVPPNHHSVLSARVAQNVYAAPSPAMMSAPTAVQMAATTTAQATQHPSRVLTATATVGRTTQQTIHVANGKQPQWRNVDTLMAVIAIIQLPKTFFNESKLEKSD